MANLIRKTGQRWKIFTESLSTLNRHAVGGKTIRRLYELDRGGPRSPDWSQDSGQGGW
jgi:hypothetical protein